MHRCFADQLVRPEPEIELSAGESHHLLRVLRLRIGEPVEIFDGRGRVAGAKLVSGRGGIARLEISPANVRLIEPDPVSITLIQAVAKHAAMEEIIPKAVELGVNTIVPVITERTVVNKVGPHSLVRPQISAGQGCPALPMNKHTERWLKIVLAAAKQCHAAWLPEISAALPLPEAARAAREDLKIFGALDPEAPALKQVLGAASRAAVKSVALFIGPEGDFTEGERKMLAAAGFKPAGFGDRVLRVETAALFGLSALNYEFRGERQKAECRSQKCF